jgi:predicted aspartyl protease
VRNVGLVVMLLSSCPLLAAIHPPATPFSLGPQGGLVVPVEINGTGPHPVLLDTGANHSSISEELARVLGATPVARALVSTPAGDRERPIVEIARLGLGPIAVTARATAIPTRELQLAGNVAGVLGQDVLAGLRYTIDYQRRRITWDDREPDARATIAVLPLAFRDGIPVVDVAQGRSMLRLVADSGAGGLVLFDGEGGDLPAMTPDGGLVRVDTFHGTTMARSVRIDRFRVGVTTYRDYPAVVLPRTAALAHRSDGLLPLHIFNRVTFDGPAGRLIVG